MIESPDLRAAPFHVIYRSTATERLTQRELAELLIVSRRNNEIHRLTGMLLYRDGTYMQYLEGRRSDIVMLIRRLRADTRHESFQIVREGDLPARMFPDWSMAYKNLTGLRSSQLPGFSEQLQSHYTATQVNNPADMLVDMLNNL